MMFVKVQESVVAVCDENLLGKTLEDDKVALDVNDFYKGNLKDKKEVVEILKEADNVNLVGDEAVACGLKAGIIEEENIMFIGDVPYALMCVL